MFVSRNNSELFLVLQFSRKMSLVQRFPSPRLSQMCPSEDKDGLWTYCVRQKKMTNAQRWPVYWLVLLAFRGWDKFLVNAVCCHATKTISLYHDPILSAASTSLVENVDAPIRKCRVHRCAIAKRIPSLQYRLFEVVPFP